MRTFRSVTREVVGGGKTPNNAAIDEMARQTVANLQRHPAVGVKKDLEVILDVADLDPKTRGLLEKAINRHLAATGRASARSVSTTDDRAAREGRIRRGRERYSSTNTTWPMRSRCSTCSTTRRSSSLGASGAAVEGAVAAAGTATTRRWKDAWSRRCPRSSSGLAGLETPLSGLGMVAASVFLASAGQPADPALVAERLPHGPLRGADTLGTTTSSTLRWRASAWAATPRP